MNREKAQKEADKALALAEAQPVTHSEVASYVDAQDSATKRIVKWEHGDIEWPKLVEYDEVRAGNYVYPKYQTLMDVVSTWNPDVSDPPAYFKETLMHFNYSNPVERAMAEKYRNAEIPFKVYDVPHFDETSEKWSDEYLSKVLSKSGSNHVEKSKDNHFMYWALKGWRETDVEYVPPTEIIHDMNFDKWLSVAKEADATKMKNDSIHYYLMSSAPIGDKGKTFIARDLPLFTTSSPNFFISNPRSNKGIQCRFGMRGIIAEAHYDSGRNMVAMLKGVKRYIINPPTACKQLAIITDIDHPSYRHSVIDWSDMKQAESHNFEKIDAIDTLVRQGEVLYIPSYWLHYIISLKYSIQCNSRSGSPPNGEGLEEIEKCMGQKLGAAAGGRLRGAKN